MSALAANDTGAIRCGRNVFFGHWDRLAQTIREIFPDKTAYHLSDLTGLRMRACEYFLSRKTGLSSDAVVSLLHSEQGIDVLAALMGDARPAWWKALKRAAEREAMKAEIADLQKRIDALNGELP